MCFSSLDWKYTYNKLKLSNDYSEQSNFSFLGVKPPDLIILTGFDELEDTPNEFQQVIDSLLKDIPCTNCYTDDILIASKGLLDDHKAILWKYGSKNGHNVRFFQ